MKKILLALLCTLPMVSLGYLEERSPLQTDTLTDKEYFKGAGMTDGNYIAEWYCEITYNDPFAPEGKSPTALAIGVGIDFDNMIIKLNGQPIKLEAQQNTQNGTLIWLNPKENIYVTFNKQRVKEDEVGMPIIYGQMTLLTPKLQESYPGIYYCRD